MSVRSDLPVAVIGAGPVGLAAAAHLIARGIPVKLYEASDTAAGHVRSWGHVRLFSPWRFNIDSAAASILCKRGWKEPPGDELPTGHDLFKAYLAPLAETPELAAVLETRVRVRSVSRLGLDKMVTQGRENRPFVLALEDRNGSARLDLAWAVIDASGTWQTQNPLGAAGLPAIGEEHFGDRIAYGIPDVLGADRSTYARRRVLVAGGGHSAANILLDLSRLAAQDSDLSVIWAVRSTSLARVFGGAAADKLPARGKLGSDLKHLVDSGRVELVLGFSTERIDEIPTGLAITGNTAIGPQTIERVDRVIVATGQRPNLELTRELRLDLDPWLEAPRALGPMIDPNVHSCGTVPPHGHRELSHPETGYYAVGVKSYGRAPTFLMATGYEQVRSVAAFIAGDYAAADDVRLVLPETGVCSIGIAPSPAAAAASCCPPPASAAEGCTGTRKEERELVATAACCGRPS
jgi:thioredoxin reductase